MRTVAISVWLAHGKKKKDALNESRPLHDEEPSQEFSQDKASTVEVDLNTALKTLDEKVRNCIVLNYQVSLTHEEIAELLEMPLGTVKSHTRDLKLKAYVRWGVVALIMFLGGLYLFSDILLQLTYVVTRVLTIEIVALDTGWMRWMLAPINTIGSLIIVTFGIARRFRQRFTGLSRSYAS